VSKSGGSDAVVLCLSFILLCFAKTASEEGYGALYKGLAPNIGRGMAMNMGMMACSDQAKEMVIAITKVLGRWFALRIQTKLATSSTNVNSCHCKTDVSL